MHLRPDFALMLLDEHREKYGGSTATLDMSRRRDMLIP